MPPQAAQSERIRLKGPDGKFYTIPSTQSGAFLRTHPDYDIATAVTEAPPDAQPTKHFWEDSPSSFNNVEGESLKRILGSLGGSLKSMVPETLGGGGALYHAAADPESYEEAQKFGKGFESRIGPMGRLIDRTAVQPTLNAADWYKQVIQGKIPDPVGQALSVGEEAVGIGASAPLLGKASEIAGRTVSAGARKLATPTDPTKAGSIFGAETRGKSMLDQVDAAAQGVPVNWKPAYEWAQKVMALGQHGFTVPKPVTDFIAWVDSHMQSGTEPVAGQPGARMDRGASVNPLPYEVARHFEQSLGAKIPWEQDPSGVMNGMLKKMRESIGQETATALEPHGLRIPYLRGKAEMAKVYGSGKVARTVGSLGGRLLGYSAPTPHPWIAGHVVGKLGESLAEPVMKSITNAGKRASATVSPDVEANSAKLIERINAAKKAGPAASPQELPPNLRELWQQGAFGKEPTPDVGAKAKPRDVQAEKLKQTAKPARDTGILERVRAEHPEWSLSQQLMEAAKRAKETGQ